jgi:hypothetical protein
MNYKSYLLYEKGTDEYKRFKDEYIKARNIKIATDYNNRNKAKISKYKKAYYIYKCECQRLMKIDL